MNVFKKVRRKIYKAFHPAMGEVWMLHRVIPEEQRSKEKSRRDMELTPEFLESKILEYKNKGYQFVSIDYVTDALTNTPNILLKRPKPFVCMTFDDGYADNFKFAYPLFKKYNIPFIIYVTTGFVDGSASMWWYDDIPQMMGWDQLQQLLQDPLCTIGAHTLTHPRLGKIELKQAKKEIEESKRVLEAKLSVKINHFSYPHGDYTPDVLRLVRDCGFKSSVLVWGGMVRPGQNCFEIPRIPIVM